MSTFRQRILMNGSIHIDDVNEILKNLEIVERLQKRIAELEIKRKGAYHPSRKRGTLYKRSKDLRRILDGDTFSIEEGRAVAEAQWTGEEKK